MLRTMPVVLFILAGCAHRLDYFPPSRHSPRDVARDRADCQAQAAASTFGVHPHAVGRVRNDTYILCLQGRGWLVERRKK